MHRTLATLAALLTVGLAAPAGAQTFTLAKSSVSGGEAVELTFSEALPAERARYWICLVKQGEADSTYGVWAYVDVGATQATLEAPEISGDYEVRLHSNYPEKSSNVIHRQALTVGGLSPTPPEGQKLVLAAEEAPVDRPLQVSFPGPLVPEADEKFWACVVMAGAPDADQGLWVMVPAAATEVTLPAPTCSGDHEVRLHANYPKKSTNVVHRLPLRVTGGPDTGPSDPAKVQASLALTSIDVGQAPTVKFGAPLRPRTGERFWVSLTATALPETAQGLWAYVEPGATSLTLAKPLSTGPHRVQVHANYPKQSRNPIATLDLTVTGTAAQAPTDTGALKPTLAQATVKVGQQPTVRFGAPLLPYTGERFWVSMIEKGKPDTEWGQWQYVEVGASDATLKAPEQAGAYEVRLHARHPTQSTNVVARLPLTVE